MKTIRRFLPRLCLLVHRSHSFRLLLLMLLVYGGGGSLTGYSQAPKAFRYQTVVRDVNGDPLIDKPVSLRISILKDASNGTAMYVETFTTSTNTFGLVNLTIGEGTVISGDFSNIDWSTGSYYLKTELDKSGGVDFQPSGVAQLLSVPYALYADKTNTNARFTINGVEQLDPDTALFEVKDKMGRTVFAVYEDGVEVTVSDGAKGGRGGFAVGGRQPGKSVIEDIMRVTPDSVRIYINDNSLPKGGRGGFAVGGRSPAKGFHPDYLQVTPDSTRVYINETSGKGGRGGFAVGGRSPGKTSFQSEYFNISTKSSIDTVKSRPTVLWYPKKEAFLTGRVLVQSPDSVGTNSFASGFESKAKGKYSQAMGYQAVARGDYSSAIGKQAIAGINSYAFGYQANAIGNESYSLGSKAYATGNRSFSIGSVGLDTTGNPIDISTIASGDYSVSIGMGSKTSNIGSIAFGVRDSSIGKFSMAAGYGSYALDQKALAIGYLSVASSNSSVSVGNQSNFSDAVQTPAPYVYVYRTSNRAIGSGSMALGFGNDALASKSVAIGSENYTYGIGATAIGMINWAQGLKSIAMGYRSRSLGTYSVAIGNYAVSQAYNSFVIGRFNVIQGDSLNWLNGDQLFVIGNGYLNASNQIVRNNALTVLKNGFVGFGVSSPTQRLDIFGNVRASGIYYANGYDQGSGGVNGYGFEVGGPAPTNINGQAVIYFHHHGIVAHQLRYTAGILYLEAAGNGYSTNTTPALNIGGSLFAAVNGGNVGIGTTTSLNKLTIANGGLAGGTGWNGWELAMGNANGSSLFYHTATVATWYASTNLALAFATNGSEQLRITPSGYVGIGTTAPTNILHINGIGRSTSATWATSSDQRVKQNIQSIAGSLNKIMQLRPVQFEYTEEYEDSHSGYNGTYVGFVAQEVQKVLPGMVSYTHEQVGEKQIDDFNLLNQGDLIPIMVNAIQEQEKQIAQLTEENARLNGELEQLKSLQSRLDQIESILGQSAKK